MSTATRALAMAVLVQCSFTSLAHAQNENWMSELKADQESLERLVEHTGVNKLSKRIDAVYGASGYNWLNIAWTVMLMKQGIIPEENVPKVANALEAYWNSPDANRGMDPRGFQGYFNDKLGPPVAGSMTIGRVLPSGRMEMPVRRALLQQMSLLYGLQEILLDTADKYKNGRHARLHAQPSCPAHDLGPLPGFRARSHRAVPGGA